MTVNGRRAARYTQRVGKLTIWLASPVAVGAGVVLDIQYSGRPRPTVGTWGEVGWEELTDGVIVAGQPDGAPSWFPCNDHPSDKASFSIAVTADAGYHVVANGTLTERVVMSSRERWCFEQREPMATYLATVQIGRYKVIETSAAPVRQLAAVPERLQGVFRHDFGRQQEMMVLFERLFGPYPFADYTVVVADDELEIPLEAQGLSGATTWTDDGATSASSPTSWRTSGSATASPSGGGRTSGCTRGSPATPSGCGRRGPVARRPTSSRAGPGIACPRCHRTSRSVSRGPR